MDLIQINCDRKKSPGIKIPGEHCIYVVINPATYIVTGLILIARLYFRH